MLFYIGFHYILLLHFNFLRISKFSLHPVLSNYIQGVVSISKQENTYDEVCLYYFRLKIS